MHHPCKFVIPCNFGVAFSKSDMNPFAVLDPSGPSISYWESSATFAILAVYTTLVLTGKVESTRLGAGVFLGLLFAFFHSLLVRVYAMRSVYLIAGKGVAPYATACALVTLLACVAIVYIVFIIDASFSGSSFEDLIDKLFPGFALPVFMCILVAATLGAAGSYMADKPAISELNQRGLYATGIESALRMQPLFVFLVTVSWFSLSP